MEKNTFLLFLTLIIVCLVEFIGLLALAFRFLSL